MERQKLKHLVRLAKRGRENRAYYAKYYNDDDARRLGIVQDPAKTSLDRVQLDPDENESLKFFAFGQSDGAFLELDLNIASLYPTCLARGPGPSCESKWRLATVDLQLHLAQCNSTLTYKHEQLLDYDEKRRTGELHESRNIYKVGALSIETVQPFSLTRILFSGAMRVESAGEPAGRSTRFVRLAISTHPTCDKFDYKFLFNSKYTCDMLSRSLAAGSTKVAAANPARLLQLLLEDRFDQPLMFQGQCETSPADGAALNVAFTMWGAKVKKLTNARRELACQEPEARDCLFAWNECGQQVHLTRPARRPAGPVYGLVHSSFDYASALYGAQLYQQIGGDQRPVEFIELDSFAELSKSHTIKLKAFQKKNYRLEFTEVSGQQKAMKIRLNGFDGWALATTLATGQHIRDAQERLLSLVLSDPIVSHKLAEERLLGGKGASLVQLTKMVQLEGLSRGSSSGEVPISVPRGLVVTCEAYSLWLQSDPQICESIRRLDVTRRVLAAKSAVRLNPLASDYLNPGELQKLLREESQRCCTILRERPLPEPVQRRVRQDLLQLFGAEHLQSQCFAVRSSAVGEDSLETSAAGQMRTILDARGLGHICRSIVECWASQFEPEALAYKSQNGLEVNLPMAVVVQELVECRAAGVAATCDPLTGDWSRLEITANRGQGEGVVAGRATDTVRVSELQREPPAERRVERLAADGGAECCLTDAQIRALSDLLLELRRRSRVKEREVEWGVTAAEGAAEFRIHLFQSRPLTNLSRLDTREIDHELDSGLLCPLDLVSRANLGEVMPGALSPLNATWFFPICTSHSPIRPYEKNQTRKTYVADQFAFHAHMAMMVVTYSEVLRRFGSLSGSGGDAREQAPEAEEDTTARDVIYSMIGGTFTEPKDEEERRARAHFVREKLNPLMADISHRGPFEILAVDLVLLPLSKLGQAREARRVCLHEDLASIETHIGRLQAQPQVDLSAELAEQAHKVYGRLLTRTGVLSKAWMCHMLATLSNMAYNTMALKLMCSQPAYKGANMIATDILNDFSVLMRGRPSAKSAGEREQRLGKQTQSGDISKLLDKLLECFVSDNLLAQMSSLSERELYQFLTSKDKAELKCCRLYGDFTERNGHRAWKEFCLATKTWGDDPSYIVRMLAMRLKTHTKEAAARERDRRANQLKEQALNYAQVDAKLTSARQVLLRAVLPRARSSTLRREDTKSALIKATHKYRLAFRHLAGLLCLLGLLPDAQLIFFLTLEELDEVVRSCIGQGGDGATRRKLRPDAVMPRLLYKARRRQQRLRIFDQVTFPRPTLTVTEMFASMSQQTGSGPAAAGGGAQRDPSLEGAETADGRRPLVRGITSCAGRVSGRACVLSGIDEVARIQPNDILITYSIDISWSVYFYMLAGIVTEVGGIVSHGAVVAREYGLPTLCTAVGACSQFQTGQRVTLDAGRAVCYLDEIEAEQAGGPSE